MAIATAAAIIGAGVAVAGAVSDREAGNASAAGLEENRAFAIQQAGQAREDLLRLFPAAEQNINLGFQAGLDTFAQTIPLQAGVFQAGNVAAQQQLLAGAPQVQAALLGGPVDFSALQPTQLPFDTSFSQAQLPEFQTIESTGLLKGIKEQEAISNQVDQSITSAFQDVLGRDPDPSALAFFRGRITEGGLVSPTAVAAVRAELAASPEGLQFAQPQTNGRTTGPTDIGRVDISRGLRGRA